MTILDWLIDEQAESRGADLLRLLGRIRAREFDTQAPPTVTSDI